MAVWDGVSDTALPGQSVLIEDNLIASVAADANGDAGATIIDGDGRVLMPGIIEAHTHIASPIAPAEVRRSDPGYVAARSVAVAKGILMRGWTTIRDIGGPSQGVGKAIDEGHVIGPHIYSSAIIVSQTSGHGDARGINNPHPNL